MNRILNLGMAVIASAALSQSAFAAAQTDRGKGSGKGFAAVTHTSHGAKSAMRSGGGSKAFAQSNRSFAAVGRNDKAAPLNRNQTVASTSRIANTRVTGTRSFAAVSSGAAVRVDAFRAGRFQPAWDVNRVYTWGGHQWRCHDGIWAVIDIGWPVYGFAYPFWYEGQVYGPVYRETYVADYPAWDLSLRIRVQTRLTEEGYYTGPIDGIFGPMTSGAIAAYQRDHDLPVTGRLNHELLVAMGIG